jgi:GGDEF domain-containing protein
MATLDWHHVPDPSDPLTPPAPTRRRRSPKFVLPDHHHDERSSERAEQHIEAFLTTPTSPRRRRKATGRPRRPVELDTRPDWTAAVRHEAARHDRYGRPASILLIELADCPAADSMDRLARVVADAIRAEARETDRAVRYGASSFRMLLPETGDRAARTVADRLERAVRTTTDASVSGDLSIDVVTPSRSGTLEEALADAERRLTPGAAEPVA